MEDLSKRLVDKSIEAFTLALEIYNKPTIKYRVEGFSFFICNAWELMLKAELINKNQSIYFKDNPERTLSLIETVRKIYPDKHTRIRLNLEKIIDLRNTSTHFITEDYEIHYAPLFQACVLNFTNEMEQFHNVDITTYIPQNFLTVSAHYEPLTNEQIKLKYPPEIAQKLIKKANDIDVLNDEFNSDKFAINIKQNLYITKKKNKADFTVAIDKNSDSKAQIIKDVRDPNNVYKYSYTNVVEVVQDRLIKQNIRLNYKNGFTTHILSLVIDFYDVKNNKDFSFEHIIGKQHNYTYSQKFIDFIINEIKKDPDNFIQFLSKKIKK